MKKFQTALFSVNIVEEAFGFGFPLEALTNDMHTRSFLSCFTNTSTATAVPLQFIP